MRSTGFWRTCIWSSLNHHCIIRFDHKTNNLNINDYRVMTDIYFILCQYQPYSHYITLHKPLKPDGSNMMHKKAHVQTSATSRLLGKTVRSLWDSDEFFPRLYGSSGVHTHCSTSVCCFHYTRVRSCLVCYSETINSVYYSMEQCTFLFLSLLMQLCWM